MAFREYPKWDQNRWCLSLSETNILDLFIHKVPLPPPSRELNCIMVRMAETTLKQKEGSCPNIYSTYIYWELIFKLLICCSQMFHEQQERTNQNARIYFTTTLPYNKLKFPYFQILLRFGCSWTSKTLFQHMLWNEYRFIPTQSFQTNLRRSNKRSVFILQRS